MLRFLHHILCRIVSRSNRRKQPKMIGNTHLADLPTHSLYGSAYQTKKGAIFRLIHRVRLSQPESKTPTRP
jgi:hypothetical protein